MYLKSLELYEDGNEQWALSVASVFDMLKTPDCAEVPKPEWWNDEGLKALSARVVAVVPDKQLTCAMRGVVLCGNALSLEPKPWNVGPRTAAEIKEAATWYRRTASECPTPANKRRSERFASLCDEVADPLLAKEEEEAAEARAAAETEAAEALEAAEAKATAAADELLADEEKEKQQAAGTKASKAKQGKGKRGKGKR